MITPEVLKNFLQSKDPAELLQETYAMFSASLMEEKFRIAEDFFDVLFEDGEFTAGITLKSDPVGSKLQNIDLSDIGLTEQSQLAESLRVMINQNPALRYDESCGYQDNVRRREAACLLGLVVDGISVRIESHRAAQRAEFEEASGVQAEADRARQAEINRRRRGIVRARLEKEKRKAVRRKAERFEARIAVKEAFANRSSEPVCEGEQDRHQAHEILCAQGLPKDDIPFHDELQDYELEAFKKIYKALDKAEYQVTGWLRRLTGHKHSGENDLTIESINERLSQYLDPEKSRTTKAFQLVRQYGCELNGNLPLLKEIYNYARSHQTFKIGEDAEWTKQENIHLFFNHARANTSSRTADIQMALEIEL
ncbi:hypothetical protein [Piscirickettsia salmonis]|uniref:hypothetical protein n=1 Tax=Piscirickettsia salmonis TaxID=1238 RepID=UPI0002DF2BF9|nr:hypothetical protein [Piscirickettsia salmonis]APS59130.1 hypothetical protein AVI52_18050 [Piscirickettsia salmonis]ERL60801.1 hypothetical protein K661_02878 [Piscirickettsia salmonis LF-89 = ATCC VR-1361]PEQ17689.1 hypothetical protein X973_00655 [Piscirickettsia salmonis]QGN79305.1 hypothetical protein Psal001_03570 [Piscirickettsia salmonis]QGN82896.1 hypothetical protein Psal002_03596 [Piscirickettsia salmonis]